MGLNGGVTIILTRGIGEPTYVLSLASRLGGTSVRLVVRWQIFMYRRFFHWPFGSVLQQLSCGEYTSLCVKMHKHSSTVAQ